MLAKFIKPLVIFTQQNNNKNMKKDNIQNTIDETINQYSEQFGIDPMESRIRYKKMVRHYRGIEDCPWALKLKNQWYESLESNVDYSGYNDDWYFTDMLACFRIYSSKYIKMIAELDLKPKNIIDLGCGLGVTSKLLKEYFDCDVVGTNLKDTKQWKYCENHIDIVDSYDEKANMIFASEYFEHIENASDHLIDILQSNDPDILVTANSFPAKSFGHFNTFINTKIKDLPKEIDCKRMSRTFSSILKNHGYKKHDRKFWNDRPQVWIKI